MSFWRSFASWTAIISALVIAPAVVPRRGSTAGAMTKAEIMAVQDAKERQKLIAENLELFRKG